jgi:hypothetical protein
MGNASPPRNRAHPAHVARPPRPPAERGKGGSVHDQSMRSYVERDSSPRINDHNKDGRR